MKSRTRCTAAVTAVALGVLAGPALQAKLLTITHGATTINMEFVGKWYDIMVS